MNFIKYITKPFKYDYNLCKEPLVESLIMLGISLVMNLIMLLVGCTKIFNALAALTSGLSGLSALFGGKESEPVKLGASGYIELILIIVLLFAVFVAALSGIILLLRKNRGLVSNFVESLSVVGSAMLLPSLLLIIPIICILTGNKTAIVIALFVYFISIFITSFNLVESMKAIGLGAGISVYVISGFAAIYYLSNLYIPIKVVISMAVKTMNSILS